MELAVSRVAERVRVGGHDIPANVVRRRYEKGLRNFFLLYRPLADSWEFLDNSDASGPRRMASGEGEMVRVPGNTELRRKLTETYDG